MSIIDKLKARVAAAQVAPLPEVGPAMLSRIGEQVSGGAKAVWCKADWGSGCDKVNNSSVERGL